MNKYLSKSAAALFAGLATIWLIGCAPTTHVTETTTTRQYDTATQPMMTPVANSNTTTTTTTRYDNGTVQQTYTQAAPNAAPDQTTTTVTSNTDDGTVQKKTTTTYTTP